MSVACERHLERPLRECTVAIQGVGHVGTALARMLFEAGSRLVIADIDVSHARPLARKFNAQLASADDILRADADVFAPCALGAILNEYSIPEMKARVVCGATNNQLATSSDGNRLRDKGILYAPDYVVNAGGMISVAAEHLAWSIDTLSEKVEQIPHRLIEIMEVADEMGVATNFAAETFARGLLS